MVTTKSKASIPRDPGSESSFTSDFRVISSAPSVRVNCSVVQAEPSTAQSAKFSEAVIKALSTSQGFGLERDGLLQEFRGWLEMERRVVDAIRN